MNNDLHQSKHTGSYYPSTILTKPENENFTHIREVREFLIFALNARIRVSYTFYIVRNFFWKILWLLQQ